MDFSISKKVLIDALKDVGSLIEERTTLPILKTIRITAEKKRVIIEATNLKMYYKIILKDDIVINNIGSLCVPYKILLDIVNGLPNDRISMSLAGITEVRIECINTKFNLPIMSTEDFPIMNTEDDEEMSVSIPRDFLLSGLPMIAPVMSKELNRPGINGMLIEYVADERKYKMVSTDGHRLALCSYRDTEEEEEKEAFSVLIPYNSVKPLQTYVNNNKNIEMSVSERFFILRSEREHVVIRMVDDSFPPYSSIIPRESDSVLVVDAKTLIDAVRRLRILSEQNNHSVLIKILKSKIELYVSSCQKGEGSEAMIADYDGENLEFSLNMQYLYEVVSTLISSGETEIYWSLMYGGVREPVVFTGVEGQEKFLEVVMPMAV